MMHEWSEADRATAFVQIRESTGSLELMCADIWLSRFASACTDSRLQLDMDNRESSRSINSGHSKNPRIMPFVRSIRMQCALLRINIRASFILGIPFNAIADHLSHDRLEEAQVLAVSLFGCEMRPWQTMPSLV